MRLVTLINADTIYIVCDAVSNVVNVYTLWLYSTHIIGILLLKWLYDQNCIFSSIKFIPQDSTYA